MNSITICDRPLMIRRIIHVLSLIHQNEELIKVPRMANQVEDALFKSTKSVDEYNNPLILDKHLRKMYVREQRRLLLMRHASKCTNPRCSIGRCCTVMKSLWKHIANCEDHACKIEHCVSSRRVLSHYGNCDYKNCPICVPVREAIYRNAQLNEAIQYNGISALIFAASLYDNGILPAVPLVVAATPGQKRKRKREKE